MNVLVDFFLCEVRDVIVIFYFYLGANILLDKSDNCKLADFGASRQIQVRLTLR